MSSISLDDLNTYLRDKFYPVGTIYYSVNSTDPSTFIGGTWQQIKDRFILAAGDSYLADTVGGTSSVTITTNNLPSHTHTISQAGAHTHTRGTMNITGGGGFYENPTVSGLYAPYGAFYTTSAKTYVGASASDKDNASLEFDASRSWTGETSSNGAHTHIIESVGSNQPINTMPPYIVAYCWKRIA